MGTRWVKVMNTEPGVVREVKRLLLQAGIPCQIDDGSQYTRYSIGHARDMATVAIHVPASDRKKALGLLRAYMAESDAMIRMHMRKLPGEIAVIVCIAAGLFILGIGANSGWSEVWSAGWPAWILLALAAPFAWRRVRTRQ